LFHSRAKNVHYLSLFCYLNQLITCSGKDSDKKDKQFGPNFRLSEYQKLLSVKKEKVYLTKNELKKIKYGTGKRAGEQVFNLN